MHEHTAFIEHRCRHCSAVLQPLPELECDGCIELSMNEPERYDGQCYDCQETFTHRFNCRCEECIR